MRSGHGGLTHTRHISSAVLKLLFTRTQSMVQQEAQAEKLTLLVAENAAGYFGVCLKPGRPSPIRRG